MLTIDKVKLIDDNRFSLLTPSMGSIIKRQQQQQQQNYADQMNAHSDNAGRALSSVLPAGVGHYSGAASSDWTLSLSEPNDSDAGE